VPAGKQKPSSLQQAHAEAYRAYLRTLRDSLSDVDIEAIDVTSRSQAIPVVNTYFTHQTYQTYSTWYTYHTYATQFTHATTGTIGTTGTIATESSIE